jgi:hypothetical protein
MPIDMKALARLGAQARIAELVTEIEGLLGAFPDLGKAPAVPVSSPAAAGSGRRKRGYKMSEETRAKLKASWAKRKAAAARTEAADENAAETPPAPASVAPKKRTMSAEARARISAAQKKRWAAQKRAAKKR